jgi:hypothetical protein
VWLVDLRLDETILNGLVRVLPQLQQISPETWAAIVTELIRRCQRLTTSLPEALQYFMDGKINAQSGLSVAENVSDGLANVLNSIQRSKEPTHLVVDAIVQKLGAGESAAWDVDKREGT